MIDFGEKMSQLELHIRQSEPGDADSVAIVRVDDITAQLRWFLMDANYQGMGIGSKLIKTALGFCHEMGYKNVFLWTNFR